jgi:hypothetical protein
VRTQKSRRPAAQTPFDGVPGFWGRLNRFMYPIAGPASIGAGHPEEPYVALIDPACPICGAPMAEHVIRRATGNRSTSLECPAVRA